MNEQRNEPLYSEWVTPSGPSFLPILAIYPTLWLTFLPIQEAVGVWLGVGLSLLIAFLMFAKSARVSISETTLAVANAQIDRRFVTGVEVYEGDPAFAERGRNLDARAWIHFQGSVKTLVKVSIQDPEDPTPYWLFSTRNPKEVKKVLGF